MPEAHDPFELLRLPQLPLAPEPGFAAELRARLVRALSPTTGGPAVPTTVTAMPARQPAPGADPLDGLIPYLAVHGAAAAIDWYVDALGARVRGEPIVMPDGRIGHAELTLASGGFMLSEEHPEAGVVAPDPTRSAVTVHAEVPDVDALIGRAARAGADVFREPADQPYGRVGGFVDPFGHRWLVSSPTRRAADPADPVRQGDIVYVSLWVPDTSAATRFYGAVLGWRFADEEQGRAHVLDAVPSHGFASGVTPPTLFVCLTVDDIEAAADRVRAAGGTTEALTHAPWGTTLDCIDDQGMRFALHQGPPGSETPSRPAATAMGGVSYITFRVADAARFRAFFSAVAGWEWSPGRVDDGWEPRATWPLVGLAGGHADDPVVVPMYRVPDIAAAVAAVRAAGGTSTEPQQQGYGVTAECGDDQGARFFLGELPD